MHKVKLTLSVSFVADLQQCTEGARATRASQPRSWIEDVFHFSMHTSSCSFLYLTERVQSAEIDEVSDIVEIMAFNCDNDDWEGGGLVNIDNGSSDFIILLSSTRSTLLLGLKRR